MSEKIPYLHYLILFREFFLILVNYMKMVRKIDEKCSLTDTLENVVHGGLKIVIHAI